MSKLDRFYVISDCHLDHTTAGVSRRAESEACMQQVVDLVCAEKAGFVFAGDLCDPDAPSVHDHTGFAVSLQRRMEEESIDAVWVTGNHDLVEDELRSSTLSPVSGACGTVVRGPIVYSVFGMQVGVLPFAPKTSRYDTEAAVEGWKSDGKKPDVVIGHLNHPSLQPGSESLEMARGREMQWPLETLARHYPGVPLIGGHYHRGEQVNHTLHIVGAPARFTFGESTHQPSFLQVDLKGRKIEIVRHPFTNVRRVYSVGCSSEEERAENIAKLLPGDIVRVLASDSAVVQMSEHAEELRKAGAAAVKTKLTDHAAGAVEDLADRPDEDARVTAEDGFAVAKRLAAEWPSADENFRTALTALVAQVGEQSR